MVSRVVLALLAFSSSLAAPALADSVPVAEAAECSEVFGDPQLRSARAARRAQLVELLVTEEGEVMLAHSQDWEEPLPLRLHGLHLTTVDVAHQQAIFELELPRSVLAFSGSASTMSWGKTRPSWRSSATRWCSSSTGSSATSRETMTRGLLRCSGDPSGRCAARALR